MPAAMTRASPWLLLNIRFWPRRGRDAALGLAGRAKEASADDRPLDLRGAPGDRGGPRPEPLALPPAAGGVHRPRGEGRPMTHDEEPGGRQPPGHAGPG